LLDLPSVIAGKLPIGLANEPTWSKSRFPAFAILSIASTLRSTSSSVVAQQDTLIAHGAL
jgi:hypothetical protein